MSLSAGTHLGPYEILAPIGAGGMGEVYKALDTRLDRIVAVKVLPGHAAEQPELRQRFEREARAVSSLNHPHICTLFDVGCQDGTDFLVMEYLEGETLAARLVKGPLPPDQLLRYTVEISEALAQAHRQGVLHRDLKPGNIMLTRAGAKLLDFGLAKLRGPQPAAGAALSALPTMGVDLTQKGSILGTFQYMAPEQLEGKDTDARTDIFAFGAVLYEMATGRKAFEGRSQASLISAIMTSEPPPISVLQPLAPLALDRVVKKCLAKDPDERWQSAQDLASELKWIAEGGSAITVQTQVSQAALSAAAQPTATPPEARPPARRAWTVAGALAVLFLASLILTVAHLREAPPKLTVMRFQVAPPEKMAFRWADLPVISPDGERLVFGGVMAEGNGARAGLWLRPIGSVVAEFLSGTEGGYFPFWSPDSRSIAFFSQGKLKRIDLSGGPPQTLSDASPGGGGTWSREGTIVFSRGPASPLYRVAATGGEAKPLTTLDQSHQEAVHLWPYFLPDGRHLLYLIGSPQPEHNGIYVGSLDSKETRRLLPAEANATYAPALPGASGGSSGYLLFLRGSTLIAQPFDAGKLQLRGEPTPVAEQVATMFVAPGADFSVSETGVLAYRSGGAAQNTQLVWLDRTGKRRGEVAVGPGGPAEYSNPALSPDEKRLAVCRTDPQTKTRDIWVFDLTRGTSSRLTFDPADDLNPTWSPDGTRIAFTSERKGHRDIYQRLANGTGQDELLLESSKRKSVEDWSPDGRFLMYTGDGLWLLPVGADSPGDREQVPFLQRFGEDQGQFSPNAKWVAYRSGESGRSEVYVQPFPLNVAGTATGAPSGGKWQVSTNGGGEPRWRHDGKELFYLEGRKLMAVEVKTNAATFEAGIPKPLFEVGNMQSNRRNNYVVSANGQRFLVNLTTEEATASPMTVVVNWPAGLKR